MLVDHGGIQCGSFGPNPFTIINVAIAAVVGARTYFYR